jgi:ZIP family zinc transporter
MSKQVLLAFALTLFAGLSTGIGSAIALLAKRANRTFLSGALGFSAGVMIYVSFVELFQVARESLRQGLSQTGGDWAVVAAFLGGMGVAGLIDFLVPDYENPHEMAPVESMEDGAQDPRLKRLGIMTALAIGVHNFPEGLATFAGALMDTAVGVSIAVAIAIHNIPEGISVSVPIFHATGSRKKAFWYSFLSGVSEPVGAVVGYLVLRPFFSPTLFGVLFAAVAGVMVFISLDELVPASRQYNRGHPAIYGLGLGMAVMAFSLLLGG